MSTLFSAIDIGATGTGFAQLWIETLSHNMANVNTINAPGEEPFAAHMVVAKERVDREFTSQGSGVTVDEITEYDPGVVQYYDPDHPLADEDGVITRPKIDVASTMADLILAQRSMTANVKAIQSAEQIYRSALQLGQR